MRIALDVMGGDHAVGVVIDGARQALDRFDTIRELHLVGNGTEIEAEVKRLGWKDPRLRILHASEVITMEDKPMDALRRKKDSSMGRAIELVKRGEADAIVSRGNTGALFATSTVLLRPLDEVRRGAIATTIPTEHNEFVLIDSGANVECRPIHLVQFALMGRIYAREILKNSNPRVGILSNGTEDSKGTELTIEALRLCRLLDINCIGNVEGHDLFEGKVDVVVCDGFVGNIVLKTVESFAKGLASWATKEIKKNPLRMLGGILARDAFRALKRKMDPDAYGGAPILGLNGHVMKAHGSAKERSIMNAIRVATETIHHDIHQSIRDDVARANAILPAESLEESPLKR